MTEAQKAALAKWLEGRPENVKKLAREFPPGTKVYCDCGEYNFWHYVVAYNEKDELIAVPVPTVPYEQTKGHRLYVPAADARSGKVKIERSE